jgi:mannose/fructose/N-acetylgalactosamine-specific phosphotransferase system component IID
MARIVAIIMGVLFILLGLTGFASNNLMGTHLTLTHNLIHLVSGAASLYIGLKGSLYSAKVFCLVFGVLYLGLAVIGYWFGYNHGETFLPDSASDRGYNENMFRMIPGVLELGTMDHIIHFFIGGLYIISALLTKTRMNAAEYLEGNSM